jgi:glucose-1-phosphate adenylyltransferase
MKHIGRESWDQIAILSGDQLYRMNLREMLGVHRESSAAVTVAMKPVPAEQTAAFGIMKTDPSGRVLQFDEKPPQDRLRGLESRLASPNHPTGGEPTYLASMGIYVFGRAALEAAVAAPAHIDFGKHVIPAMLDRTRVQAYLYDGYWEDVGTIRSYYEANLALTAPHSAFSFYHPRHPIFMTRAFLAPTKMHGSRVNDALVSDGCYLENATIDRSVIGPRTRIGSGATIRRSLILGADFYDANPVAGSADVPAMGIGEGSLIEDAIIDKNARVGRNVRIGGGNGRRPHDGPSHFVREGLVIVPKGGVVPDGTVI